MKKARQSIFQTSTERKVHSERRTSNVNTSKRHTRKNDKHRSRSSATTQKPTTPTSIPTSLPSVPTGKPSMTPSGQPSGEPSSQPSGQPTSEPTQPTSEPSSRPSSQPSGQPTSVPTNPTSVPTVIPTGQPTGSPTTFAQNADEGLFANATVNLFAAARSGSIAAVEKVIQDAIADNTEVKGGGANKVALNALTTAIFDDQTNLAEVLIEKAVIPIDDAGVTGNTPLMWASIFCKTNVMQSLLSLGASVSLSNKDGDTPLSLAKKGGCVSGVAILRSNGAIK